MPFYEIVLRFRDRDELRLADRNGYERGAQVTIAQRRYRVVATEPPRSPTVAGRFVLVPLDE